MLMGLLAMFGLSGHFFGKAIDASAPNIVTTTDDDGHIVKMDTKTGVVKKDITFSKMEETTNKEKELAEKSGCGMYFSPFPRYVMDNTPGVTYVEAKTGAPIKVDIVGGFDGYGILSPYHFYKSIGNWHPNARNPKKLEITYEDIEISPEEFFHYTKIPYGCLVDIDDHNIGNFFFEKVSKPTNGIESDEYGTRNFDRVKELEFLDYYYQKYAKTDDDALAEHNRDLEYLGRPKVEFIPGNVHYRRIILKRFMDERREQLKLVNQGIKITPEIIENIRKSFEEKEGVLIGRCGRI